MKTEAIYKELHEGITGYVRKRVNDPMAVEDIVQDIFLKAHTKVRELRDDSKMAPWLYRIARNRVIDHYRERKSTKELPEELPDLNSLNDGTEIFTCLHTLISSLPNKYREPLFLSDVEGVKQGDIAEQLGLSPSGARSRVQRARKMVKERFDACCVHYICEDGHTVHSGDLDAQCKVCNC